PKLKVWVANQTPHELHIFEDSNSWGWGQWQVSTQTTSGAATVLRASRDKMWTMNLPISNTVPPFGRMAFPLDLSEWNIPLPARETIQSVRLKLELFPDSFSHEDQVWTGTKESDWHPFGPAPAWPAPVDNFTFACDTTAFPRVDL